MQSRLPGPQWEEECIPAEAHVGGRHTHMLGTSSTAGSHLGPSEAGQLIGLSERKRGIHDPRKQNIGYQNVTLRSRARPSEVVGTILQIFSLWCTNTQALNGSSDLLGVGKGIVSVLFLEETLIFPLHEGYRSLCRPPAICAIFRSPFAGGTGGPS